MADNKDTITNSEMGDLTDDLKVSEQLNLTAKDTQKSTYGILTVSDRCFNGEKIDESGPLLKTHVEKQLLGNVVFTGIVPDDKELIRARVKECCDLLCVNVLLLTGGTGISPRDVTPEAVDKLLSKIVGGFSNMLLQSGLKQTPFAALSRSTVGVRNKTLVICLPGSSKGAVDGLKCLTLVIPHAVDLICEDLPKVAHAHGETNKSGLLKSKVIVNVDETSRKRQSDYPMEDLQTAERLINTFVNPSGCERVASVKAFGRILSEHIKATVDMPPHRTSLKDGYACKEAVGHCKIVGESKPGNLFCGTLSVGEAVRVSTGSIVPHEANCVIPVECTTPNMFQSDVIQITKGVPTASEIREIGSDFKKYQLLLKPFTEIGSAEISLLAANGISEISVFRKPKVGILSTGDELQDPWAPLDELKVRDSNKVMLMTLIRSWGYEVEDMGIVTDDPDQVLNVLAKAFEKCDLVVSTGGMSMGERDLIKQVLITDLNAKIHFGRLALKPGKPTGFGSVDVPNGEPKCSPRNWIGLPGNPASAFVMAHLIVKHVLNRMRGKDVYKIGPLIQAQLENPVARDNERLEFKRGFTSFEQKNGYLLVSTKDKLQRSSNIFGCSRANCLIQVPSGQQILPVGSLVTIFLL